MDAEMEDRMDRIWIAFDCGDWFVASVMDFMGVVWARWRVREGSGENATMEVDTTIRKEV
jgi:hypothetical protein